LHGICMAWHGIALHCIASNRMASHRIASHSIASHRIASYCSSGNNSAREAPIVPAMWSWRTAR
jgi:hypothetical protein